MKTYKQKAREAVHALEAEKGKVARLRNALMQVYAEFPQARELVAELTTPQYAEFHTLNGQVHYLRVG